MTNYTVDYFIQKFSLIPEYRFAIGQFVEKKFLKKTKYCAQGLCLPRATTDKMWRQNKGAGMFEMKVGAELIGLIVLFGGRGFSTLKASEKIATINNGSDGRYQQPTPKQRILAALYDIRDMLNKKEEVVYSDITKQLAVLPIEETTDIVTVKTLQS
jgi:hypothetical protein